jgi:hypothetical protein
MTRQMHRHIKNDKRKPDQKKLKQYWVSLYTEALLRAQNVRDPRIRDLLHIGRNNPEKALRSLSITSRTDLDRELPAPE